MFALACQLAPKYAMNVFDGHQSPHSDRKLMRGTLDGLEDHYEELMLLVEEDLLLKANDIDGKAGELLASIHAKISFAKMLSAIWECFGWRVSSKYDVSELNRAATQRLEMVFQLLPNSSMRGEYAEHLRSPSGTELPMSYTLPFQSTHEAATMKRPHPEQEQSQSQAQKINYSKEPGKPPLPRKPSKDVRFIP